MNLLRSLFMCLMFYLQTQDTNAQTLPVFMVDRRMDSQYMDSVSRLARRQYQTASDLPATTQRDTLRFQALYYLGRLYSWWENRQDSSLYFGNELTQQARLRHNTAFEVKGLLISEFYYNDLRTNYPEALRLNYQARAILQRAKQDPMLNWRIDLNLGGLYSVSGDYENALKFLSGARTLIEKGSGVSPQATIAYLADIEQKLGIVYEEQKNYAESEKHYLAAEKILVNGGGSRTNFGFVYEVLSAMYLVTGAYEKAIIYAKKAEPLWEGMDNPYSIANNWSILAVGYAATGQYDLALQYARKVLNFKPMILSARKRAFLALHKIYKNKQDWRQSLQYYEQYVALADTIRDVNQAEKLASSQRKSELELLSLQNQQAQQLQAERLLTVQKQAELNQLRADARANLLNKKVLLAEQQRLEEQVRLARQQRLVENERAKTALIRQRDQQKLQAYAQQADDERRTRSWLMAGLLGVLLFTLALGIVYEKNRAQQRQIAQLNAGLEQLVNDRTAELLTANDELLQKNQAIKEADARIIQTQETERQRIAADLHDDLGGTLATLRRRLTDLRQYMHEPKIIREFDALQPLIQKSSADLRRIAHNLMPPEFARIGLRYALEQLVRSQPMQPTRFNFLTSGPEQKLLLNTELNAYRIVSELVQNINKHAQANQVAVQLLYHNDQLTITVEDDGLGNRVTSATGEPTGIGLKNIRLRAEYIGATLWRESGEAGTLVILDIPYSSTVPAI